MKTIPLCGGNAQGRVVRVDDDDYELVKDYRWLVWQRTPKGRRRMWGPYARTTTPSGVSIFMHKMLTGWDRTDHADHDGLNNQRYNLRQATSAQHSQNRRSKIGTSSRYKGVTWHKKLGKWQAAITANGKHHYLGVFASEEDAARAYDDAARDHHGEFACLNFSAERKAA